MKINKKIEIVRTSNAGFSSLGLNSSLAILSILKRHYKSVVITTITNMKDLEDLIERSPDLVINGVKYIQLAPSSHSRVWVSDFLECRGIAVTGSGMEAHILEADKLLAKQRVLTAGLNTSNYIIVRQNEVMLSENIHLSYPVFIKPSTLGGGVGIDNDSVAYTFEQLSSKVQSITQNHSSDSLIEEYLSGREFSVAILKDDVTHQYLVMPIELIAPLNSKGNRILTHEVKSGDTETFTAVTSPATRLLLNDLAIDVFHALGARDYGRIDIRMDRFGVPQFLEANLIPSLVEDFGNFPKSCKLNMNLNFESIILQIVRLGLVRENFGCEEYSDGVTVTKLLTALEV